MSNKGILVCAVIINKAKHINTVIRRSHNICNNKLSPNTNSIVNGTRKTMFWYSTDTHQLEKEVVSYEDVKKAGNDPTVLVIDVREPEELRETGVIPGSINIPLGDIENILRNMSTEDFLKKYSRQKPSEDFPIIFSCRSGKRSANAQIISKQLGFINVKNYLGGWIDWEEKHK